MNKYGDIVLTKNDKNNFLSMEQYKEKLLKEKIQERLLIAEKQI